MKLQSSIEIFIPDFVFPDVDSGFLKDKNVEFDGDLSKINDWIQEVFEKDLARNFPPKVSEDFLEKVNYLMEMFPNMPNDYIKDKVKVCMFLKIAAFSKQQSPFTYPFGILEYLLVQSQTNFRKY